jgi:putative protein-disulfide isomerase
VTVELLYFANPMCSWCWGFAPVIGCLAERHGDSTRVTLALGALGRGQEPMRPQDKASVRGHWEHVAELTGQPFDFAFFDREGFVYDTEPACRAVAAVRAERPDLALPYLHALQRAFYAEDRDVTEAGELRRLAEAVGYDGGEAFDATFAAPATRAAVAEEFAQTARLGVAGYPTLLALAGGRAHVLSLGCRPLADVEAALVPLLEQHAGG